MARIKVPFLGMSTTPTYQDGECRTIVNMRPKNGVYKPVAPRKVLQTLSQEYDIVFVHRGNGYENWIGVRNEQGRANIFRDIKSIPVKIGETDEFVNFIEQIGNTLSMISSGNIYYLLYHDSSYSFLGKLPQLPAITFQTTLEDLALTPKQATGLNSMTEEEQLTNIKSSVNIITELFKNGGTDTENNTYAAKGQHLFDAHVLRYAFRLYDNSLIHFSPPILLMPSVPILEMKQFKKNTNNLNWYVHVKGFRPVIVYEISEQLSSSWSNVIKSIDFFISRPIGISNIENMIKKMPKDSEGALVDTNLISYITNESLDNLHATSNLYFIHSMPINGQDTYTLLSGAKDSERFKNLQSGELMQGEPFSHHSIGAQTSNTYNNRLHLGDIKTTFFNGFNPKYFAFRNSYNGTGSLLGSEGGGTRPSFVLTKMIAEVTVNANGERKKLFSEFNTDSGNYNISAYLSYPDPRAEDMSIYALTSDGLWMRLCSVKLVAHKNLNIAYYINYNLNPVGEKYQSGLSPGDTQTSAFSVVEPNKVKVSELNNPFYFPNMNNYSVGNGTILALETVSIRISEGSFGQYPLYVFTTAGVYSLQTGIGDVLYTRQHAPTSYEQPVSKVFCKTPYGVIFISNRGICLISGQEVIVLSPQLREDSDVFQIEMLGINNNLTSYPDKSFTEYLGGIELMLYNPYYDELTIVDKDSAYSYVYNFPSKSFYLSTEKIDNIVQNAFPDVFVIAESKLKDYKQSAGKATQVAVASRPLRFGTEDLKKLERVIMRSLLFNVNNNSETDKAMPVVHHSLDGIGFITTRGFRLWKNGNYKDFDMGLFARTKFREYLFTFFGTVDEESEIRYVEFEIDKEYGNEKMR